MRRSIVRYALLPAILLFASTDTTGAALLVDSISVAGDSISRAFDADTSSCNYGDNTSRNWATGDNHGSSFCNPGGDGTFSLAERLECEKGNHISNFNHAASGAEMVDDFFNQASAMRVALSASPAPRLISVLLGHNDACTSTLSKTGNSCGGDRDPNNYCRTTNEAFEREFRRGMDQLIQISSARIAVLATIRVSQLCNLQNKNGCGLTFGLDCDVVWQLTGLVEDVFGSGGICASLTSDCSNQRRLDMYNTLVGYNEILERVTNEYAAIPAGGMSATGAVKEQDVVIRYGEGSFYYKIQSNDLSCCDCFHPSDLGQAKLAEFGWNGLQCSSSTPCCGVSGDPLTDAKCALADTTSFYEGGFWAGGVICGNGVLDPGEECDDGNNEAGDCCSGICTAEPAGSPCPDDGNACTTESCNASGTCLHTNNSIACNDGVFCNGADSCSGGSCSVHAGDPCFFGFECNDLCNEAAGNCFVPFGTLCTDDGNVCSDDVCNGAGSCAHISNNASCDDGLFCNGPDTCSGGVCAVHSGDPCSGGPQCADTCNESTDDCIDPTGSPCEDGDACTTNDMCSGGTCFGGPPPACDSCQTCDSITGCTGPVCTPTPAPTATPTSTPTATPTPAACGNGSVEAGEQCDDGNTVDGDCCSATCAAEPDGPASCDGNACTRPDACLGGVCIPGACADGSACTICGGVCDDTGSSCECLF